jgi:hypothetical protein
MTMEALKDRRFFIGNLVVINSKTAKALGLRIPPRC